MSNFCCQACGYDHCNDQGNCAACAWHPRDDMSSLLRAFNHEMSKLNAEHTAWLNQFEARNKRMDRLFTWSLLIVAACIVAAFVKVILK